MNQPATNLYQTESAKVEVLLDAGVLVLVLAGTIDLLRPDEFLDPIFERVDAEARATRAARVKVDITALVYLNSNGIKSVANWVQRHATTTDPEPYAIEFRYDPAVTWQRATMKALTAMTRGTLVTHAI